MKKVLTYRNGLDLGSRPTLPRKIIDNWVEGGLALDIFQNFGVMWMYLSYFGGREGGIFRPLR